MGFSLTSGTGTGFNLGGSETAGFSLPGATSQPGNLYALDSPSAIGGYPADLSESQKFSQFYPASPAGSAETPWWSSLATYGATRAIDAAVGRINPTQAPTTYAGQNGQTYVAGQVQGGAPVTNNGLMMLLLGGLALYAMGD